MIRSLLVGKVEEQTSVRPDGFPIDANSGSHILKRGTCRIEHDNFVVAFAARNSFCDNGSQLAVNIGPRHETLCDGMVKIADRGALIEHVHHDFARRHELRIDLLFIFAVRADCCQECSRLHPFLRTSVCLDGVHVTQMSLALTPASMLPIAWISMPSSCFISAAICSARVVSMSNT